MKIGDKVINDLTDELCTIISIQDRNETEEKISGVTFVGNAVTLEDRNGVKSTVYEWEITELGFSWRNDFEGMTKEHAQTIKALRVFGCSWGRISEIMQVVTGTSEEWGQVAGRDMCSRAAEFFNEEPNSEPWN